ncbi:MAG: aminotransferase class V-fold PLP-dependent enzyme [Bacteriovoracaceae bacterium]
MALDVKKIRSQFPCIDQKINGNDLIYLDNAASTLKPLRVINALNQHYSKETSNIHRGVHTLSEKGTVKYEESRRTIQKFIGAKFDHEVIFTKGTTDSLNLLASSFGEVFLKPGDEILLSTMEHHSNIVPWQLVAEKTGAIIKEVPINNKGEIILEEYKKLLSKRTKMVSIVYISNSLGTINPIKEMIKMAHDVGSYFCVDAAQAVAHKKINVQELDCDFLAFSGHKIYGPTGIGVLYGKEELLNQMPPYQGGGDMIDAVSFERTTYNKLPFKFEAGTPHIAGAICLKDAIDFVTELGLEEIENYENELLDYATKKIKDIEGITLIGEADQKCSVLAFCLENAHPHDVGTLLDKQGIAVRTGHHCTQPLMKFFNIIASIRASFSIYNTKEEVDSFIEAVKKTKEFL